MKSFIALFAMLALGVFHADVNPAFAGSPAAHRAMPAAPAMSRAPLRSAESCKREGQCIENGDCCAGYECATIEPDTNRERRRCVKIEM